MSRQSGCPEHLDRLWPSRDARPAGWHSADGSGCNNAQLYVYTPTGSPLPKGQPQALSVSATGDGCGKCYLLTGTGLNGISEGASYGDDAQMATDFLIMKLTDGSGNVAYART